MNIRKIANFTDIFAPDAKTKEDDLLGWEFGTILKRCKDVTRNYDIAQSISSIYVEYIGNVGNRLQASAQEEAIFNYWAKSATTRGDNWNASRRTRIKELVDSGGLLVLFVYDEKGTFRINLIQGGSVANPPKVGQGEKDSHGFTVFNGICFDVNGLEVGYHYFANGKWEYTDRLNSMGEYKAYFERSPLPTSAQQTRPFPLIASVLIKIEDRQLLWDYVMTASRNTAALGLIITTDDPQGLQGGLGMQNNDGTTETVSLSDEKTQIQGEVLPQMVATAPAGTKVQTLSPDGNFAYDILLKRSNQEIGAGVVIPEAVLFADTSGNFASAKLSAQPFLKRMQHWGQCVNELDDIIYDRVMLEAQMSGEFSGEKTQHSWIGDVNFNDVDSSKSAAGSKKNIEAGKSTRTMEAGKDQVSFDSVVTQSAKELKTVIEKAKEFGVPVRDLQNWMSYNIDEIQEGVEDAE